MDGCPGEVRVICAPTTARKLYKASPLYSFASSDAESDSVEISESVYKGHPTLSIKFSEKAMPFSFGLSKAKAILGSISAIEAFVSKHQSAAPVAAVADQTPAKLEFHL